MEGKPRPLQVDEVHKIDQADRVDACLVEDLRHLRIFQHRPEILSRDSDGGRMRTLYQRPLQHFLKHRQQVVPQPLHVQRLLLDRLRLLDDLNENTYHHVHHGDGGEEHKKEDRQPEHKVLGQCVHQQRLCVREDAGDKQRVHRAENAPKVQLLQLGAAAHLRQSHCEDVDAHQQETQRDHDRSHGGRHRAHEHHDLRQGAKDLRQAGHAQEAHQSEHPEQ
mmetsp:Transcript_129502/g.375082  ORF Transcript_129502/g.375082 Transcript_129502/m.375082 type:complete len:221 (+) Transcript_129502:258-920(+)